MRKIIQIQTVVVTDEDEDEVCVFALCDDGTLWTPLGWREMETDRGNTARLMRKEFTKAVKVAVIKRATRYNNVYCEECGVFCKTWDIDHDDPDGLTGEPTLENAKLLCKQCHAKKTKKDLKDIAQAKRREAKNLGIRKRSTLKSAGFPKSDKPKAIDKSVLPELPRRGLYQ
jgi:5-methylcytosine-specific restriction endonuclease McrA